MKEIQLKDAVKALDEMFNVKNFTTVPGAMRGITYRTDDYEYNILTSEMAEVDVLSKLFEFFTDTMVIAEENGEKRDIVCEITDKNVEYTVFKLV